MKRPFEVNFSHKILETIPKGFLRLRTLLHTEEINGQLLRIKNRDEDEARYDSRYHKLTCHPLCRLNRAPRVDEN